jgi:hypothetical protein
MVQGIKTYTYLPNLTDIKKYKYFNGLIDLNNSMIAINYAKTFNDN